MSPRMGAEAVDLEGRRTADASESLQGVCARPACQQLFARVVGPGRPAQFCDENCRREAQRERRAARTRLAHYERQVKQLRAYCAALDVSVDEIEDLETEATFLSAAIVRRAEDAVAESRGMARFLRDSDDSVAIAFVELLDAVTPIIAQSRTNPLPLSDPES